MSGVWELIKRRNIGAHAIYFSGRTVDGCDHCLKTAIDTLDDLGFDATVQ